MGHSGLKDRIIDKKLADILLSLDVLFSKIDLASLIVCRFCLFVCVFG